MTFILCVTAAVRSSTPAVRQSPELDPGFLMNPSVEQLQLAARLDDEVEKLMRSGNDDIGVLVGMADLMPDFRRLLDDPAALDALCASGTFPGLFHYAKILERMARGIQDGAIKVPK